MFCRHCDGRADRPIASSRSSSGSTRVGPHADQHDLLVRRQPGAAYRELVHQVGQGDERRAADPTRGRRQADVEVAVLLLVHADVVAVADRRRRRGGALELAAEVLVLDDLAELVDAPVGDQELQTGARAQPPVAVVAEDRRDGLPHVGHVLGRDPDAGLLRQHRVGRQPAADPEVEARAELGVHGADERHVVGLGGDVVARVAGQGGLELARQVREPRVADVAAEDLVQGGRAVDDLVLGDAGDRRAEERPGRVAAGLDAAQPGGVEAVPDRGDVLDADPVVLDVLAVGDVGGVTGEVDADAAQRSHGLGREQPAVGADPQHEVLVVELVLLEDRGLAAVDAGLALRVEAHPAEPAAEVGGVDRVEAALGVDVDDPGADVERVVVLLGLLVLVQRLGVAERPLALGALGPGDLGVPSGLGLKTKVRHWTESLFADGRARRWARRGRGGFVSAKPTHRAARAPEVHVAASHEVHGGRNGGHVNESQGLDAHPTNRNPMC